VSLAAFAGAAPVASELESMHCEREVVARGRGESALGPVLGYLGEIVERSQERWGLPGSMLV